MSFQRQIENFIKSALKAYLVTLPWVLINYIYFKEELDYQLQDAIWKLMKLANGSIIFARKVSEGEYRLEYKQILQLISEVNSMEVLADRLRKVGYFVPGRGGMSYGYLNDVIRALAYPHPTKGIIIEGDPGTGKTYIAEKLYEALKLFPELRLIYLYTLGMSHIHAALVGIRKVESLGDLVAHYAIRMLYLAKSTAELASSSEKIDIRKILDETLDKLTRDNKTLKKFFHTVLDIIPHPREEWPEKLNEALGKDKDISEKLASEVLHIIFRYDKRETLENALNIELGISSKALEELEKRISENLRRILFNAKEAEHILDILMIPAFFSSLEATREKIHEILKEHFPYVFELYPEEDIISGVHFEKYVCGREDEFPKIFGYRDMAKIAVVANLLGYQYERLESEEQIEIFLKRILKHFNDLIYGSPEKPLKEKIENILKFFRRSAFGKARLFPGISVVLIDEADKMDVSAEVQLYECLDRAYVTIDYFGMLPRMGIIIAIFTSNRAREFSEPFVRRNLYATINRQDISEEDVKEIVKRHIPAAIIDELFRSTDLGGERITEKAIDAFFEKFPWNNSKYTIDEAIDTIQTAIRIFYELVSSGEFRTSKKADEDPIKNKFKEIYASLERSRVRKRRLMRCSGGFLYLRITYTRRFP